MSQTKHHSLLDHTREENKRVLDKEMKRLCYLGILKEGFSAFSNRF